jgi:hypothetical protein
MDETEYKKNFNDFKTGKAISSPNRFENIAVRIQAIQKNMILRPPSVKFNASTSYNDHYKDYTMEKQYLPNIECNT